MEYGPTSPPRDQPMIVASSDWSPVVSLVTRPWNASGAAFALMPSPLYCSAATWASVSRSWLPELVEMVRLNFLPALFWRMPSDPGVQPASFRSCCALALSNLYGSRFAPAGYAHWAWTWCETFLVASPKTTALMTASMSMPEASAWRTRLSARAVALGLAVFQPMNVYPSDGYFWIFTESTVCMWARSFAWIVPKVISPVLRPFAIAVWLATTL